MYTLICCIIFAKLTQPVLLSWLSWLERRSHNANINPTVQCTGETSGGREFDPHREHFLVIRLAIFLAFCHV